MQTMQSLHYDGAPQEKWKQKNRPFLVKYINDRIIRFVLRLVFLEHSNNAIKTVIESR